MATTSLAASEFKIIYVAAMMASAGMKPPTRLTIFGDILKMRLPRGWRVAIIASPVYEKRESIMRERKKLELGGLARGIN